MIASSAARRCLGRSAGRVQVPVAECKSGLYLAHFVQLAACRLPGGPMTATRPILAALSAALVFASADAAVAQPPAGVLLAPHRAVYDLKLVKSRGTRNIETVRGRILYDFSGNACEGYTLQFRQVSQLASTENASVLSDLRATTWEDGAAQKFRFNSRNLLNEQQTDAVDGHADRSNQGVTVTLMKPEVKTLRVPAGALFPTEHMRRIVDVARAGKTLLEAPVYDGSDNGQKIYNTLTVIGKPIAPGGKPPQDSAAKIPALAEMTRWPVTISYFEQEKPKDERTGEQQPVYAISFELYENGISRALSLEYSDFTLAGELTALEMKKADPCP
jgi:hypothetical protein